MGICYSSRNTNQSLVENSKINNENVILTESTANTNTNTNTDTTKNHIIKDPIIKTNKIDIYSTSPVPITKDTDKSLIQSSLSATSSTLKSSSISSPTLISRSTLIADNNQLTDIEYPTTNPDQSNSIKINTTNTNTVSTTKTTNTTNTSILNIKQSVTQAAPTVSANQAAPAVSTNPAPFILHSSKFRLEDGVDDSWEDDCFDSSDEEDEKNYELP